MNGNPFKPVASGDSFEPDHAWLNALTAAAQGAKRGKNSGGGKRNGNPREGMISVSNGSGKDIKAGQILGITDILISPSNNLNEFMGNFALVGKTPDSTSIGCYVIAQRPIAKNKVGDAYVFGLCPAQVMVTSSNDTWAEAVSGQSYLKTGKSGSAQILYLSTKDTGTGDGTVWALIRFPFDPGQIFPVTLSNPTGSNGSNSPPSAATLVYDVKAEGGTTTLKTGVGVWMARQAGHVTAATKGLAFTDHTGTLQIAICDEVLDTTQCT